MPAKTPPADELRAPETHSRQARSSGTGASSWSAATPVDEAHARVSGFVARGFEEVRAAFERNFDDRGEIGAAVAAYWRGEKVVDLWGGHRMPNKDASWNEDTLIVFMSSTKGLAAMTLAVANARGWLDYDAPVARYWPEFAQNGKADVTVRQLLGHAAGLVLLDEQLRIGDMRDLDAVGRVLARQKPAWPPGTRHGYHTMSLGLYMQELIRHVDPLHRTLGRFFEDEIAAPLGIEFYIGLPSEIPDDRLATVKTLSVARALWALPRTPPAMLKKYFQPGSMIRKSFLFTDLSWNDRRTLEVELPAGNGVGTARAIARAYSAFAEGGAELGITPETFARITALPPTDHPEDVVLGVPTYFSLGFLRPGPDVWFGSSPRAFCAPGAGGSFACADPDARVGYAYVTNKLDFYYNDDPREKPLRDALYRAIRRTDTREKGGASHV
jgi:CubicO group peptidase (beta-lactamase class C family)